jgi:hypothetical protein
MPETLPVRTPGTDWLMARMMPFRFDNLTGIFHCAQLLHGPVGALAITSSVVKFAIDSPLEGSGFELPVPVRQAKLTRSSR